MVIDASMAAAWMLPDEQSAATDAVMSRAAGTRAVVPALIWLEARNLLLTAERRKRIPAGAATSGLERLRALRLEDAGVGEDGPVLALARRRGLSAWDAAYLALAAARRLPLATLDRRLAEAARAEGVALVGPLA